MHLKISSLLLMVMIFLMMSTCDKESTTEPTNNGPTITNLIATMTKIPIRGSISISCDAIDVDQDTITYHWSSSSGSYLILQDSMYWNAPEIAGNYQINCEIQDGNGGSDTKSITIEVVQPIITNGLTGFWHFCGNSLDASGNEYDGTVAGAQPIEDRFGNPNCAYYFDGVDDYITIKEVDGFDEFDDPETEFTLSAWCNPDPGVSGFIFSNCSEDGWLDLRMSNQIPRFGIRDKQWAGTVLNSDESVSANEWHHFVGIFNDPDMTIYVDGQNKGTTPFIGEILSHGGWENGGVRIGVYYLLDPWYFKGGIDDVRIYNRVLNETEILELFNEDI